MKRFGLGALALLSAFILAGTAPVLAQGAFPTKPVTLVVPFNAGGPTDVIGRMLAQGLSEKWKQPVVVVNKPGSGSVVGTDFIAKSAPDGHTLGMAISAHYINPAVRTSLPYNTEKDLAGVSIFGVTQVILIAKPDFPANNIAQVIAEAKKRPNGLTYAVAGGAGSSTHMAGELLAQMAGVKLKAIPYQGSGEGLADLAGGRVDLMFDPWTSVRGQLAGNKVKVVANATMQPVEGHPEFDSIPKAFPGYDAPSIQGIIVSRKTPKAIIDKLSADLREVVLKGAVGAKIKEFGMIPVGSTAEEYDRVIHTEIAKWAAAAAKSGIKIE